MPARPGSGSAPATRGASRRCSPAPRAAGTARRRMTTGSMKCSCRWSTYSIIRPSSRAAHRDVVEGGQVLDELAQADATGVRADGHPELGGQQQDRDDLVDATEPARVDLADAEGPGRQELLEHDPVVDVLAGGDPDGRHGPGDRGVTEDVVGAGRLLDPVRVERRELRHPVDGDADIPALVGVDGEHPVGPDLVADDPHPAHVVLDVGADLHLEPGPAGRPAPPGTGAGSCRRRSPASRRTWCRPGSRRAGARPRARAGPAPLVRAARAPRRASGRRSGSGNRRARRSRPATSR